MSVHTTQDTSIEFVDVHATNPAEFTEQLLSKWWTDVHKGGETNIDVIYTEELDERTLYVVRVETTHE